MANQEKKYGKKDGQEGAFFVNEQAVNESGQASVTTLTSGTWSSQVFTGANEATNVIDSIEIEASTTSVIIQINDLGASTIGKLGVVIGAYTEAEADTAIDALFAGTSATGAFQLSLGDELQVEFVAGEATIIAWKSSAAEADNNELIVSWKV